MKMAQTKQLATERAEVKIAKVAVACSLQSSHLTGLPSELLQCLLTTLLQSQK